MENNYYDVTTGKQAELSPLQKMYLELGKIIEPRLLGDFCGYNEETQGFDIVLATKEIIEAKEQECEALKKQLEQQEALTETYKACYRAKHNDVKDKLIKYKQALDEIEEFCIVYSNNHDAYETVYKHILDIINKAKEK